MLSMRTIFKDKKLDAQFQSDGYVILKLASPSLVDEAHKKIQQRLLNLQDIISKNTNSSIPVTYHSTFLERNRDYKKIVWEELSSFFMCNLLPYLDRYKLIQTNIFNKPPQTGYVIPHQNLTTVDETQYTSVSIWTPLQITDINNGALYLLPKSHKQFEKYRNVDIHWAPLKFTDVFADYNMIPVCLDKGEVVVFDDSIIHGSPSNKSGSNRIVFHSLAIPEEATPIYCHKIGDRVDIYEVEDDFWQYFMLGEIHFKGNFLRTETYEQKNYHLSDFIL